MYSQPILVYTFAGGEGIHKSTLVFNRAKVLFCIYRKELNVATYIFECLRCDKENTHTMSMKVVMSSMKLDCDICGQETFQKQKVKPSPIHFKGGGWPDNKNR